MKDASRVPEALAFIVPEKPGSVPLLLQLLLLDFVVDLLKLASLNTPDALQVGPHQGREVVVVGLFHKVKQGGGHQHDRGRIIYKQYNMLSNSFSMLGALILGDFAVQARWLVPEVLVYMAFVAIANFAQPTSSRPMALPSKGMSG